MMKHYEVVAAVIEHDGKILCMQRNKGKFDYVSYKFEFPGGKVEAGEERHTALERELREEMDMDISIPEDAYLMTVEHTYPDFALTMHACAKSAVSGFCPASKRTCAYSGELAAAARKAWGGV